ncbi:MAG TPA: hypothetical protein VK896_13135 [Gaiellaceae bacterium]|nr:hypothetical protein [Gaiellaceae bacterium]
MGRESYGPARALVPAAAATNLVIAVIFALGHRLWDDEPPLDAAGALGDLALAAAYAVPALLALVALRGRPLLLFPAAGLAFLFSFTALSGVSLVLLIPAAAYLVGFLRAAPPAGRAVAGVTVVLVVVALGVASFLGLFARGELVCWRYEVRENGEKSYERVPADVFSSSVQAGVGVTEAGSGCEERPTVSAALASLGLLALLLLVAARVTPKTAPDAA